MCQDYNYRWWLALALMVVLFGEATRNLAAAAASTSDPPSGSPQSPESPGKSLGLEEMRRSLKSAQKAAEPAEQGKDRAEAAKRTLEEELDDRLQREVQLKTTIRDLEFELASGNAAGGGDGGGGGARGGQAGGGVETEELKRTKAELENVKAELQKTKAMLKSVRQQLEYQKQQSTTAAGNVDMGFTIGADGNALDLKTVKGNIRRLSVTLMSGDGDAQTQTEFDKWDQVIRQHPEYIMEQENAYLELKSEHAKANDKALETTRRFLPPGVFTTTFQAFKDSVKLVLPEKLVSVWPMAFKFQTRPPATHPTGCKVYYTFPLESLLTHAPALHVYRPLA